MREFSQDVKGRNYDARYIYHLEDRICNWKQHVEESQIGSRKSMQMWGRGTICINSSYNNNNNNNNNNNKALKVVIAGVTIGMSSNCLIKCPIWLRLQ